MSQKHSGDNQHHHSRTRRDPWKKITGMLLSFFAAVSLVVMLLSAELFTGFLNPSVLKESMLKTHYVRELSSRMREEISAHLEKNGIPLTARNTWLPEEDLYLSVNNAVESAMNGKEEDADEAADNFTSQLKANLAGYLITQGAYMTPALEEAADAAAAGAGSIYRKYTRSDLIRAYNSFSRDGRKVCVIATLAALLVFALCAALLFLLYKYKHHAVRKIIYASCAACIINIIFIGAAFFTGLRLPGTGYPEYYTDLAGTFFNSAMMPCYVATGILLLIIILLFAGVKKLKHSRSNVSR